MALAQDVHDIRVNPDGNGKRQRTNSHCAIYPGTSCDVPLHALGGTECFLVESFAVNTTQVGVLLIEFDFQVGLELHSLGSEGMERPVYTPRVTAMQERERERERR